MDGASYLGDGYLDQRAKTWKRWSRVHCAAAVVEQDDESLSRASSLVRRWRHLGCRGWDSSPVDSESNESYLLVRRQQPVELILVQSSASETEADQLASESHRAVDGVSVGISPMQHQESSMEGDEYQKQEVAEPGSGQMEVCWSWLAALDEGDRRY